MLVQEGIKILVRLFHQQFMILLEEGKTVW